MDKTFLNVKFLPDAPEQILDDIVEECRLERLFPGEDDPELSLIYSFKVNPGSEDRWIKELQDGYPTTVEYVERTPVRRLM